MALAADKSRSSENPAKFPRSTFDRSGCLMPIRSAAAVYVMPLCSISLPRK